MRARRHHRRFAASALALAALLLSVRPAAGLAETYQPVLASLHVHSTVSTGDMTLDQLADRAERQGLDAIILSENFTLRYEYGLFPFRGVLRRSVTLPSVIEYGIDRFLADVAAVQARHPRLLIIPGVEVVAHYYWTGSLLTDDLTMHDAQKNLLVIGMAHAEDYAALPATGNPHVARLGAGAALDFAPVLLLAPAAWLWPRRSSARRRRSGAWRRPAAILLICVSLAMIGASWPFGRPVFSPYEAAGVAPHQAVIDHAAAHGGLTFWSMPEARDFEQHRVARWTVTTKTDPHPEMLQRTHGYTGFGGVYQDNRTVTQPGGLWDQLLSGAPGFRPVSIGESAFHAVGHAGKDLDQVLTVLLVRERTHAGALDALKHGRLYAVQQPRGDRRLVLDRYELRCADRRAVAGETLRADADCAPVLDIAVSSADGSRRPVTVTVVKNGHILKRWTAETPLAESVSDVPIAGGARTFHRLIVESDAELLANPIFVESGPRA
jgi:hypothetical protein